jgi:hypothetical protein
MMLTVPSILKQPARAYGADDDKSTPLAFSILYSIQITLNNRYWDTSGECRSREWLWVNFHHPNHENIFVIGPCGVGKSFLASALAQKACRDGHSALYLRAAALLRELALARADGSLRHLLARLSRIWFWLSMTGPWRR